MTRLVSAGMAPAAKRYLVPIGGNELKSVDSAIYKRIIQLGGGAAARIAVIPTASSIPEERARVFTDLFTGFEPESIDVLMIDKRSEASDPEALKVIEDATVVMFGGGDQFRLADIIGGTSLHRLLLKKYSEGCVVAGTSAGAAAMPKIMIFQNSRFQNCRKGGLEIRHGLGFIDAAIFDTHFVQRNRISRLVHAVAATPSLLGMGIEEDTALVIGDESVAECVGTGTVIVVDGSNSEHINIGDVPVGKPFTITNISYSVLTEGMSYDLTRREAYATAGERVHLLPCANGAGVGEE